jgi:hypothetical protein
VLVHLGGNAGLEAGASIRRCSMASSSSSTSSSEGYLRQYQLIWVLALYENIKTLATFLSSFPGLSTIAGLRAKTPFDE